MSAFKQKLARLGASAGILAGTTAAVLALGGITAGSALAEVGCPSKTTTVSGSGSSLQRVAQENWIAGYGAKCTTGPVVKYTPTSSGKGLEEFRFTGHGAIDTSQGFIGTDDAPSTEQIEDAEGATEGGKASGANPIIIPVAETSIAVAANVPSGCVIKGGITWSDLNKLFNGTITTWAGLETDNGNAACNTAITRVVRRESSGTTYQFKNYLSTLETTSGLFAAAPGCGLGTWASLEAIRVEEQPNITWPENGAGTCTTLSPVHRAEGGGAVAEFVADNANTIGYASLPDVKAKGATAVPIQDAVVEEENKYGAPGKEEESGKKKLSNCGARVYNVPAQGQVTGTGESVDWSQVFGASPKVGGGLYPLCTLTYDVGWSSYAKAGYGTAAAAIKEVLKDYLGNFVDAPEGGAIDTAHWYQTLPAPAEAAHNVQRAAELAISKLAASTCPSKTTTVSGSGSSLQKVAQENWTAGYNSICSTGPVVKYSPTSSGKALAAFRFTGAGTIDTTQGFIATDDAPGTEQIGNAEAATEGGKTSGANPIIIPVAETSIAVMANVPGGCVIKGGITWSDLNKLFNGTITTWAGLETDNGDAACSAGITRVVHAEGSGTTYQFKHYLSALETTSGILAAGPGCGLGTWASLEKVGTEEKPNITWPESGTGGCSGLSPVHRSAGGGAAEYVAANANTIGYASLPEAKAKGATAVPIQDAVVEEEQKYAAPGKEEESGKKKLSNCGVRSYAVPLAARRGIGTGESADWSQVFGASPKVGGGLYPLCTLTYDVGWSSYAKAGYGTAAAAIKEVLKDYLGNFVDAPEGGAIDTAHWYQTLPAPSESEHNVQGAAELAISKLA